MNCARRSRSSAPRSRISLPKQELADGAQSYVKRAREGANRAHAILTAMSEATRVEQSIEHTERVRFDINAVVRNMGQAYRESFSKHRVEIARSRWRRAAMLGSPDLIAQLLDKLMDNAADFAPPDAPITIALEQDSRVCRLEREQRGSAAAAADRRSPVRISRERARQRSGQAASRAWASTSSASSSISIMAVVSATNLPDRSGVDSQRRVAAICDVICRPISHVRRATVCTRSGRMARPDASTNTRVALPGPRRGVRTTFQLKCCFVEMRQARHLLFMCNCRGTRSRRR